MNDFLKRYKEWGFPQREIQLPKVIRINTLKASAQQVKQTCDAKLTKISFLEDGYVFDAKFSPASTPQYLLGQIYVQEAASQLPVQFLELDETQNQTVLDMCAAPGSKTTQVAQKLNNTGAIIATDNRKDRCEKLINNLERCGVSNCVVKHTEGFLLTGQFDRILLDAPCSGNFIGDKKWFDKRTMQDIKSRVPMQKQLLKHAIQLLKPGGILIYSTCSLEIEENEEVVESALEAFEDVKLVPIQIKGTTSPGLTEKTKACARLWPSISGTQGFFMAKFVKED